jgi:polar amino acid transport system permease protein
VKFDSTIFFQALFSNSYLMGALLAIGLASAAQLVAVILGFFIALGRLSKSQWIRKTASLYVWFFRAIPALLLLLIAWNALPQVFPILVATWYSPFVAALIGLSLSESAYMAEILRAALISVDEGQSLAARALGMTPYQVMRKVLLPQLIRIAIPPTGNEYIGMIKYTSLASVISLQELLTRAQNGVSQTFRYAEYYAAALVYYLVIVSVLMVIQAQVEKRYAWTSVRKARQAEVVS